MREICIHVTDQQGETTILMGIEGWRVMEVIRDMGLPIKAECGGSAACATCHVHVAPEWFGKLPSMQAEELHCLDDAFDVRDTSRLSCQIILTPQMDGLAVTLAPGTEP